MDRTLKQKFRQPFGFYIINQPYNLCSSVLKAVNIKKKLCDLRLILIFNIESYDDHIKEGCLFY